jgi:hypothetical protein
MIIVRSSHSTIRKFNRYHNIQYLILPDLCRVKKKPAIKILDFICGQFSEFFLKNSTKNENEHKIIFQKAVRKYVDKYEEKNGYFFALIYRFKKTEKFCTKNAENFHNVLILFDNFTNSKMYVRTKIFPRIDKNDFL